MEYRLANGSAITDEDIERECAEYESGSWEGNLVNLRADRSKLSEGEPNTNLYFKFPRTDAGIGVLYCGSDHMPNGLALPLGAHSRHAEIVEHQLAISKPLRNQIWKRIVNDNILEPLSTLNKKARDEQNILIQK